MVYESGFTTRRSYATRPIVSSYTISSRKPIDWAQHPFVARPTLVAEPVTAFGRHATADYRARRPSILEPINRAAIRPSGAVLRAPIEPYVATRDKNRDRILSMVHQYIDTVEAGGNTAARTSCDSMDSMLPHLHRAAATSLLPVKRETYKDERSGATVTRYSC